MNFQLCRKGDAHSLVSSKIKREADFLYKPQACLHFTLKSDYANIGDSEKVGIRIYDR